MGVPVRLGLLSYTYMYVYRPRTPKKTMPTIIQTKQVVLLQPGPRPLRRHLHGGLRLCAYVFLVYVHTLDQPPVLVPSERQTLLVSYTFPHKHDNAAWYIERQYKWLEADLAAANANRTQAPW